MDTFVMLVCLGLIGLGIFRLFFHKPSASVVRVRDLIADAKALDKGVKDAKTNSNDAVVDFKARLNEYRAKYGGKRYDNQ